MQADLGVQARSKTPMRVPVGLEKDNRWYCSPQTPTTRPGAEFGLQRRPYVSPQSAALAKGRQSLRPAFEGIAGEWAGPSAMAYPCEWPPLPVPESTPQRAVHYPPPTPMSSTRLRQSESYYPGSVEAWNFEARVPADRLMSTVPATPSNTATARHAPIPASQTSSGSRRPRRPREQLQNGANASYQSACLDCQPPQYYPNDNELKKHIDRCHSDPQRRRVRCLDTSCSMTFNFPRELYRHVRAKHPRHICQLPLHEQKMFGCRYCEKEWPRKDHRDRHESTCSRARSQTMSRTSSTRT